MKSFVAIFLAFVFILQNASKLFVIANYELNKSYISKNLCENRKKPVMKCNGKCHLKKQLQKEDKKENSTPTSQKEKSEVQFFSIKKINWIKVINPEEESVEFIYQFTSSNKHLSGVFHPPQIS